MIERVAQSIETIEAELEALPPPITVSLEGLDGGGGHVCVRLKCDDYQLQMDEILQVSLCAAFG